ncbi:thioesterase family protein [Vreelandella sp. EE22]
MMIYSTCVAREWVDYNGHMNDAEYARVFSLAVEALMAHIGLDQPGRETHHYTLYTLETHLCYRREAHEGEPLAVKLSLLDHDAKRLHVFFELLDNEHGVLATSEQMLMGIDQQGGRSAPFPEVIARQIATLPTIGDGAWPTLAGRRIGISR